MSAGLKTASLSPVLSQFQRARRKPLIYVSQNPMIKQKLTAEKGPTLLVHQTTDNASCSPSRRVSFPSQPQPRSEANAKGDADASMSFGCGLSAERLGYFSSSGGSVEYSVEVPPSPQRSQRPSVTSPGNCTSETRKEKRVHRPKPDPGLVLAALDDLLPPGSNVLDFDKLMEEHEKDLAGESLKNGRPMNESGSAGSFSLEYSLS